MHRRELKLDPLTRAPLPHLDMFGDDNVAVGIRTTILVTQLDTVEDRADAALLSLVDTVTSPRWVGRK